MQSLDISVCLQLVDEVKNMESADAILEKCMAIAKAHYPELMV